MLIIYGLFVYWILCAFYGNELIQKNIFGVPSFYLFMGVGLVCLGLLIIKHKGKPFNRYFIGNIEAKQVYKGFILLSTLMLVYVLLSYVGLFTLLFSIDAEYEKTYVLRHGYLVFTFPVLFTIIYYILKHKSKFYKLVTNEYLMLVIWLILFLGKFFIGFDVRTYRSVILFFATAIMFFSHNKFLSSLVFLLTVFFGLNINQSSTSVLSILLASFCCFFSKTAYVFFHKQTKIKMYALIVVAAILIFLLFNGTIMIEDPNAMWRIQYWVYEMKTLAKTGFLGVGYGVAYASPSLLQNINNPFVFTTQAAEGTGIFVISQHNSFINCFYRLGFVGLILTISAFIEKPMKWVFKEEKENSFKRRSLLNWALFNYIFNLCIVIFNPGFESPPFYIGFIFSFAVLVSIMFDGNKIESAKSKKWTDTNKLV